MKLNNDIEQVIWPSRLKIISNCQSCYLKSFLSHNGFGSSSFNSFGTSSFNLSFGGRFFSKNFGMARRFNGSLLH